MSSKQQPGVRPGIRLWGLGRWRRLMLAVGGVVALPRASAAQGGDSTGVTAAAVAPGAEAPLGPLAAVLAAAAETITAAELTRHLHALAADSLRGRATSGAALDAAARYVAAQFQQLGLRPGGPGLVRTDKESAQWLKRYPLPGARQSFRADVSELRVAARLRRAGQAADALDEQGQPVERGTPLNFATTAHLMALDSLAESTTSSYGFYQKKAPVLVVSGRHPAATLPCERAQRQLLLYVPPAGLDTAAQAAVLAHLTRCAPVLVVAAAADSAAWAARQAAAADLRLAVFERYLEAAAGARAWAIAVAPPAVQAVLQAAGLDLAATWADTTPRVRALPALQVSAYLPFGPPPDSLGVYVTGVLPGTDTLPSGRGRLAAEEYVIYVASLDGNPLPSPPPGASAPADTAAASPPPSSEVVTEGNVAGLLALAKAFSQPGARPRRSVVFLATSGARHHAAASSLMGRMLDEQQPLLLVLEQLGSARGGDTLAIAGLSEFRFARDPAWLAGAHPELHLTLVDGGTILRPGSDAYAFARYGAASLALAPARAQAEPPRDHVGEAVTGMVPAVRFAFYLGQELANSPTRPQWTPAARSAWLRGLGR